MKNAKITDVKNKGITLITFAVSVAACTPPEPAALDIIIDTSCSMNAEADRRRDARHAFNWWADKTGLPEGSRIEVWETGRASAALRYEAEGPHSTASHGGTRAERITFRTKVNDDLHELDIGGMRRGSALFRPLAVSADSLREREGFRALVLLTDGRARDREADIDFENGDIIDASTAAAQIASAGLTPDLSGIEVVVCGIHDQATTSDWAGARTRQVTKVWTELLTDFDAERVSVSASCNPATFAK